MFTVWGKEGKLNCPPNEREIWQWKLSPKPLQDGRARKEEREADDHLYEGHDITNGVVGNQTKLPLVGAAVTAHDCRPRGIDAARTARSGIRNGHHVKRPRRNYSKAEEGEYQARGRGEPHKDTDVGFAEAH